jgi:uncharacterized protein (DUF488 family)
MTVCTIGYEGQSIHGFVSFLKHHKIKVLIDIRELPLSRKKGFSKTKLAHYLSEQDISYIHIPALGCPKPIRNNYKQDGIWSKYKKAFLKYLTSQEEVINHLVKLTKQKKSVLLCYEADYQICHRSMVAEAVEKITNRPTQHLRVTVPKTENEKAHPMAA